MKKLIAILLTLVLLTGCTAKVSLRSPAAASTMDFALNLFREAAADGENTLISPLSVLTALAMTANGAEGETLTQMESVLGGGVDDLDKWLDGASGENLKLANGIWMKDDNNFHPGQEFLKIAQKEYKAKIETAPFDDSTAEEINDWVRKQTDGMIDSIVDEFPEEAVLYLINALAFEAQWAKPYADYQVQEGTFTTEDGKTQTVEMMYDAVENYLRTKKATGFLKWYEGDRYAFAALLPNEGVSVTELLDSLTSEELAKVLANPEADVVQTAIPKFRTESDLELKGTLEALGMPNAFDAEKADLTPLGTCDQGNLYISKVKHKTFIEVGELGTRAGAATAVEIECGSAMVEPTTVYLDRPFVYMIVDMELNYPIFMGTCMEVNG